MTYDILSESLCITLTQNNFRINGRCHQQLKYFWDSLNWKGPWKFSLTARRPKQARRDHKPQFFFCIFYGILDSSGILVQSLKKSWHMGENLLLSLIRHLEASVGETLIYVLEYRFYNRALGVVNWNMNFNIIISVPKRQTNILTDGFKPEDELQIIFFSTKFIFLFAFYMKNSRQSENVQGILNPS